MYTVLQAKPHNDFIKSKLQFYNGPEEILDELPIAVHTTITHISDLRTDLQGSLPQFWNGRVLVMIKFSRLGDK